MALQPAKGDNDHYPYRDIGFLQTTLSRQGEVSQRFCLLLFLFCFVMRMYLSWSLCAFYLHACQVRVTVGDSGLCRCIVLRISSADSLPCVRAGYDYTDFFECSTGVKQGWLLRPIFLFCLFVCFVCSLMSSLKNCEIIDGKV